MGLALITKSALAAITLSVTARAELVDRSVDDIKTDTASTSTIRLIFPFIIIVRDPAGHL